MSLLNQLEVTDFYGVTTTKGDLIVNDGTKNARLAVGTNGYQLVADSTETTGLKWIASGAVSVDAAQYTLSSSPISTNSTTPILLNNFTNTPAVGNYVIMCELTYALNKTSNRSITLGFYKNNVLVSDSARTFDSHSANAKTCLVVAQYITSLNGSDVITVKFNVNNVDTTASIYSGNLLVMKFTDVFQYNVVTPTFETNATVNVNVPGVTNTPTDGNHLLLFNATFSISRNNATATFGLYKSGTLITGTERVLSPLNNIRTICCIGFVSNFSGFQELTCKVKSSATNNGIILYERNLLVLKIS